MSKFYSARRFVLGLGLRRPTIKVPAKRNRLVSAVLAYTLSLSCSVRLAAIKDKEFPHYRTRYETIKHRRGYKKSHYRRYPHDVDSSLPHALKW